MPVAYECGRDGRCPLEQELGRTPRVAEEVAEVAQDIRRNLAIPSTRAQG